MSAWAVEEELNARLEQTERRLSAIAERYALATAAASVGVWDWNLESGAFYLDPNIKAFLGYRDDEIPNDIAIWAEYIHPDDKDAVMKAAQDAIDGRSREYVFEHRMCHKDGSVRWFLVRGKVIRNARNRPVRFVGTDTDITERRQLEQKVGALSNEIQTRIGHDLHDTLGQELTGLSLELRGLENTLAEDVSPHTEHIRKARNLAERAIETTRNLARGLSPVLRPAQLAQSLSQLAESTQRMHGVECRIDFASDAADHTTSMVANELYRIAQEAVTNAVRHGRATRIDIEATRLGRYFLLSVADDGIGFTAAESGCDSMGVRIMHYRARHLGGNLTIGRRRSGGTLVVCTCPLSG